MEIKKCRKCQRELPLDYKYNLCEYCRNKKVSNAKKIAGVAAGVIGAAVSAVALAAISKNKKD